MESPHLLLDGGDHIGCGDATEDLVVGAHLLLHDELANGGERGGHGLRLGLHLCLLAVICLDAALDLSTSQAIVSMSENMSTIQEVNSVSKPLMYRTTMISALIE